MGKAVLTICTIVLIALLSRGPLAADEVIMKTGDRFTSSRVWEEDDKVLFDMQGLIVKVNKREVAAVIRGGRSTAFPSQPDPGRQTAAPPVSNPPPRKSPSPADSDKHLSPKVRGIGFDGLVWQIPPGQIRGIAKLGTDPTYGGIDQYWRPAGNLALGEVLLDGLVFGFWRNRLYTIMLWVDGKPAYTRLQKAVFDRYGSGRKNEKGLQRYIWIDDTTDRMLEFDQKSNTGIFWMRSRELDMQVKQLYPENE
jgi:hypothetical protein